VKNKKLLTAIAVLSAFVIILGYLNMKDMDKSSLEEGNIRIISGENATALNFEEITALPHHDFKAVEDTSSSGPASRKYKGVLLRDVLNKASIDNEAITAASKVFVKGLDGYVIALAAEEVLADTGIYLAFEKNGKPLGNMKNGGSGPFQLIAVTDSFSQRWCKYVFEVSLE